MLDFAGLRLFLLMFVLFLLDVEVVEVLLYVVGLVFHWLWRFFLRNEHYSLFGRRRRRGVIVRLVEVIESHLPVGGLGFGGRLRRGSL